MSLFGQLMGERHPVQAPLQPPVKVPRVKRAKPEPKAKRYPMPPPNPWGVTRGEAAVLRLLTDGLSQTEAAERLCLSFKTVNTLMSRARERMGDVEVARATVLWDRLTRNEEQTCKQC